MRFSLSPSHAAILAALGLQRKSNDDVEKDLDISSNQMLALLN